MSGQISESKINEVRERSDIVELVSQYVTLKRSGANYLGLCPFHTEKTPSFNVNAARQFFHCFGCGVGGDVFAFLMKIEGLSFPDAVRRLAERAGIELEERRLSPEEERRQEERERLFRINEAAAAYYHRLLMEHPAGTPARAYMRKRGYGRKAAQEYRIGYALDSWEGLKLHLEEQKCSAADAGTLGLIRPGKKDRGDYDLFRGRLIFPISDMSGRIVAFAGRVLDDGKPKYINSPESPVYHKSQVLFGLYQARQAMRQSGEVILVEGYFDQLALYRAGFPQVVATCGTALTVEHARILKRYVQRVLLLFDQDEAGRQATFKAMAVLQQEGLPAAVVTLPGGEDPDSFVGRFGPGALAERLEALQPAMEVFMHDCLAGALSVEEKAHAAEQVLAQLRNLSSPLERDLYLKELARLSGIGLEVLKNKQQAAPQPARQRKDRQPPMESPAAKGSTPASEQAAGARQQQQKMSHHELKLLHLLAGSQTARDGFQAAGGAELLLHPDAVALAQLIVEQLTAVEDDIAACHPDMPAARQKLWQQLQSADDHEFDDNIEQLLAGYLWKFREMRLRRRIEELRKTLIPEADGRADKALADRYRYELSELQQKVKSRRY